MIRIPRWQFWLLSWLGILLPAMARGGPGEPTCALLVDPAGEISRSPVVALVEARLLESKLKLVERQAIEQVLKEQELSALLGPEAVGQRVRLGRLLKADVLAILRPDPATAGQARLVVCETSSGIRMVVRPVSLTGDAEAVAAEVGQEIITAARRQADGSRDLCAVPPFVSKDLLFDFDAMKAAYAALTEQAVASRVGLWTVELAEARALERELLIGGEASAKLNRPMPLYVLGEYRNDGLGADRRVSITLVLKQGEKELVRQSVKDLRPADDAEAIGKMVEALFADKPHAKPEVRAAGAELKQLMRRAADFEKTGDWREAADLYEACLLLDPSREDASRKVMDALIRLPRRANTWNEREKRYQELLEIHLRERRRFHHQELYARQHHFGPHDWSVLDFDTANIEGSGDRDPRVRELMNETRAEARRIVVRLIHQRLDAGAKDNLVDVLSKCEIWWQLEGESIAEGYERLLDLARSFQHFPKAKEWTAVYTRHYFPDIRRDEKGRVIGPDGESEWQAYLSALESLDSEGLRQAAAELRRAHGADLAAATQPMHVAEARRPQTLPTTGPVVRLRPVDLSLVLPPGPKQKYPPRIVGWMPAGRGVDVLWGPSELYVMKEPGVAKRVWTDAQRTYRSVDSACFDGRYVWAAGPAMEGRLIVLDPQSEQTWELGKDDGLLPMNSGVALAPLGPGRVCVVGGFQPNNVTTIYGRGWCAIVTFDPKAGKSVDVFYEAKRVIKDDYVDKLSTNDVAFAPAYLFALGEGPDRRLIVGRNADVNAYRCFTPPLVIDPEKRTVRLWEGDPKLPGKRNGPWTPQAVAVDGALYFAEPNFVEGAMQHKGWRPKLFRAAGADATVKVIGQLPPLDVKMEQAFTSVAAYDGQIYLAGVDLFVADPATGAARLLPHLYPDGTSGCERLAVSGHFGLITWRSGRGERIYYDEFYRFELPAR